MYCTKCGADNSETAVFCRRCGVATEGEEETRVAIRRPDGSAVPGDARLQRHDEERAENEPEIFSISPTLMFVKGGYVLAAVGALFIVAVFSAFTSIATWVAILIGLMLFLVPAFYHFRQKMVRYTLTDSKLEIDEGFISRNTRSVPIRRIQDVTVSSGVAQRLLGFGDLMIDNASDEGGKVVLKNINKPKHYADVLLKQMRRMDQ